MQAVGRKRLSSYGAPRWHLPRPVQLASAAVGPLFSEFSGGDDRPSNRL